MKSSKLSKSHNSYRSIIEYYILALIFFIIVLIHLRSFYSYVFSLSGLIYIFFSPIFIVVVCTSLNNLLDLVINYSKRLKVDTVGRLFKLFILLQILFVLSVVYFFSIKSNSDLPILDSRIHKNQFIKNIIKGTDKKSDLLKNKVTLIAKVDPQSASIYPVRVTFKTNVVSKHMQKSSIDLIKKIFPSNFVDLSFDFPDLKFRLKEEIVTKYPIVFSELPKNSLGEVSYDSKYKNPCWIYALKLNPSNPWVNGMQGMDNKGLACLPYAYVLGQPKCGTSGIFDHFQIIYIM